MHLLTFFESAAVAPYYPEKKKGNKGEEQDSTQAGISVAASKPTASNDMYGILPLMQWRASLGGDKNPPGLPSPLAPLPRVGEGE